MHIFFCGWTRYLLADLFDVLIPAEFSWANVNERTRGHCLGRGVSKLPVLEPRSAGKKISHSLKLNAAQTMYFM